MGELDINALLQGPEVQAAGALILALILGYAISTALTGVLARAASRTETDLDDHLIAILRVPVLVSAALLGIEWAGDVLGLEAARQRLFDGALGTLAVVMWVVALVRAGDEVLLSLHRRPGSWLRGRVMGLMHYAVRVAVLVGATYVMVLLWGIDPGAWEVSAGVAGVVLALAAQDSLGNTISAVFILADRPVRIGDHVRVDGELRGRVTDIGWRSTRILTNDGIEVNLPNGQLSTSRVINESAGPQEAIRIRCEFPVEYGRAPEEIAALVLPGAGSLPHVVAEPQPALHFLGQTEAGLRFALLVYIADPARRLDATDVVNAHIYRALRAAGVGFAYPTHGVQLDGSLVLALRGRIGQV